MLLCLLRCWKMLLGNNISVLYHSYWVREGRNLALDLSTSNSSLSVTLHEKKIRYFKFHELDLNVRVFCVDVIQNECQRVLQWYAKNYDPAMIMIINIIERFLIYYIIYCWTFSKYLNKNNTANRGEINYFSTYNLLYYFTTCSKNIQPKLFTW